MAVLASLRSLVPNEIGVLMTFGTAIRTALVNKYATFSGRASRSEFWWVMFIWILLPVGLAGPIELFGLDEFSDIVNWVFLAVFGVPAYAVTARRLHDVNRSGWWQMMTAPMTIFAFLPQDTVDRLLYSEAAETTLALFVPLGVFFVVQLILGFVLLIWFIQRGTIGHNRYGEDPLDPGSDAEIFA